MNLKAESRKLEDQFKKLQAKGRMSFMETCIRQIYKSWILKDGYVGIDIGAHKGLHTFEMADSVGPSGQIFAFEANPHLYLNLCSRLLPQNQVTLINAAVSDSNIDLVPFYLNPAHPGQSTIVENYGNNFTKDYQINVPCVSIDSFLGDYLLQKRLAFVKIDAEGAELKILKGMKQLLSNKYPLICAEISLYSWIKCRSVFDELLGSIDYAAFTLSGINISELTNAQIADLGSPAYTLVLAKKDHWSFDFANNPAKMCSIVSNVVRNALE